MNETNTEYQYSHADNTYESSDLFDAVKRLLAETTIGDNRIFELGCGNGYHANQLADLGYQVTAVDHSQSGIDAALQAFHRCAFSVASA